MTDSAKNKRTLSIMIIGTIIVVFLAALLLSVMYSRMNRMPASNAIATSGLAQRLYEDNHYDEAIALNQTIADGRAANWLLEMKTGNAFFKKQDYTAALSHYQKSTTLNPDVPLPYYNLALCLLKMNRKAEAISTYQAIIDQFAAEDEDDVKKARAAIALIEQTR